MRGKTHTQRKKKALRTAMAQRTGKPRNPLVVPSLQRAAGPHRTSVSGQRQAQKRQLRQKLATPDEE